MSIKTHFDIPDELIARRQFVLWRYEERDGRCTKVPYQCTGYRASSTNPEHWSDFGFALKMAQRPGFCDGLGYVFSPDDPFCGLDLDHIWRSDADEGAEWGMRILDRFADTYSEVSPSEGGVKVWCRAKAPRCGRWPIEYGAIEIYDHSRFFTLTGRSSRVHVITNHQSDVEALVANLDEDRAATPSQTIAGGTIPQGQRHNTLVKLAGGMWRRGLTAEAIEAALLITDAKQCAPPHGPAHVRLIVQSMQRWER